MTNYRLILLAAIFTLGLFTPTNSGMAQEKMEYPKAHHVEQVDNYFGEPVRDPFRWLEDDVRNSDDVRQWVQAQNKLTFSQIEKLPFRKEIEKRLTALWDYEKYGTPFRSGDRYFYFKNSGLQNQSVLYKMNFLDDAPEVLVDPNKWSEDGTDALGGLEFSPDGKLMAYGVQKAGSDWRTWEVLDVETGKKLSDELNWLKWNLLDKRLKRLLLQPLRRAKFGRKIPKPEPWPKNLLSHDR